MPAMILGETALSFIGLGMQTAGGELGGAAAGRTATGVDRPFPWLLLPAVFVIVTVLSFNFLGDGLRDAADPYTT